MSNMLSPVAELRVGNARVRNFFTKLHVWLSRKEPADRVEFSLKSSLPELGLVKDTPIEIWLGYNPDQIWRVFAGYITDAASPRFVAKDEAVKLFRTKIVQMFQNVSPQDIIRYGLQQAGILDIVLAPDTFPRKARFAAAGEHVSELVSRVNATWRLDFDHYFDSDRRFHWDAPVPKPGRVYSFEYGQNIIELDFNTDRDPHGQRAAGDTAGAGRLLTVLAPFVGHSQEIGITWPNIGDRQFITETAHHFISDRGALRTELFFRELVA